MARARRRAVRSMPDPEPKPPMPPGPTGAFFDKHGETALSLILLITLVIFMAVSTGLSIVNTIELAKIKKNLKFVERLESKQASEAAQAEGKAMEDGPGAMLDEGDAAMIKADAMLEGQEELLDDDAMIDEASR
jgi:hypothetical protein